MPKKKWDLLIEPYLKLKEKGYGCNVIAKELNISKSLAKKLRILTNSKISNRYLYDKLSVSDIKKIIACVLGDGCITKHTEKSPTSFCKISHIIDNLDYMKYKKKILDNLANEIHIGRKPQSRFVNNKWITCKEECILTIKSTPHINFLHDLLYVNNKKAITREVLKYFNEMTIAMLYFDDGCFVKSNKTYKISMGNMDITYIDIFTNWLKEKYNIETNLHKCYNYYNIYIKRNSHKTFENIIKKYLVNSMNYKINDEVKLDKLLENPEEDNQQPIITLNE